MKTRSEGTPLGPTGASETLEAGEFLRRRVEERAYELFERRGRTPGRHLDDWLEAERQVLQEIRVRVSIPGAPPPRRDAGRSVSGHRGPAPSKRRAGS